MIQLSKKELKARLNADSKPKSIDTTSSQTITKPNVSSSLSQLVEDMLATAELFQDECHALTKEIIEQKPKCTVQDATNVWMFKKLAEFEVRLRLLEFVVQPNDAVKDDGLPSTQVAQNKMLAAVILEPTCMLRLNMCRNRNGTLEQLWIDKISRKEYWESVPSVYVNAGALR